MKIKNKMIAAIAVLGLAVAGLTATSAAYAADLGDLIILSELFNGGTLGGTTGRSVTVQSGDTLSGIAATFLGNANLWPSIASLNSLSNPDLIFPGQVLSLPAATLNNGDIFGGNSLGNLLILDQLFGGDGGLLNGGFLGGNDLGDLLILNQLFGTNGNIFNGGMLGGNSLGNLLILDQLFGGDGGLLNGGGDLGNLLILDQLFGGGLNNL